MLWRLFWLFIVLLSGCRLSGPVTPTATPDPVTRLERQAAEALARDDRETEALALRDALERLPSGDHTRLAELRGRCVEAMVEAGGHASSLALWSELAQKNPEQKEQAEKMVKRARQLVLQQGRELLEQVVLDEKAGHRQSALCSALASVELLKRAGAEPDELAKAEGLATRLSQELQAK